MRACERALAATYTSAPSVVTRWCSAIAAISVVLPWPRGSRTNKLALAAGDRLHDLALEWLEAKPDLLAEQGKLHQTGLVVGGLEGGCELQRTDLAAIPFASVEPKRHTTTGASSPSSLVTSAM